MTTNRPCEAPKRHRWKPLTGTEKKKTRKHVTRAIEVHIARSLQRRVSKTCSISLRNIVDELCLIDRYKLQSSLRDVVGVKFRAVCQAENRDKTLVRTKAKAIPHHPSNPASNTDQPERVSSLVHQEHGLSRVMARPAGHVRRLSKSRGSSGVGS